MSSPPGPAGGRERVDPQLQAVEPNAGQRDAVAAPRREARAHAHRRDLQEGGRSGRDPGDAQPAQLQLGGGEPQAEGLHRHRPLEDARERALDEVRAPFRGAPQRVERGRAEHEREKQELAPTGHGSPPALADHRQQRSGLDRLALADQELREAAAARRSKLVLHLHRLDHDQALSGDDVGPGLGQQPHDAPGHRRREARRSVRAGRERGAAAAPLRPGRRRRSPPGNMTR